MRLAASFGLVLGLLHGVWEIETRTSHHPQHHDWSPGSANLAVIAFPY